MLTRVNPTERMQLAHPILQNLFEKSSVRLVLRGVCHLARLKSTPRIHVKSQKRGTSIRLPFSPLGLLCTHKSLMLAKSWIDPPYPPLKRGELVRKSPFLSGFRGIEQDFIATARSVRTGTFLWTRSARPQKCPKQNGDCYSFSFKMCVQGSPTWEKGLGDEGKFAKVTCFRFCVRFAHAKSTFQTDSQAWQLPSIWFYRIDPFPPAV
jgi:hypothetical protein